MRLIVFQFFCKMWGIAHILQKIKYTIMRLVGLMVLSVLIGCGLAACAVEPPPAVILTTPTPTSTVEPSASPVWFPATETPTSAPTITPRPTLDYKPGVGEVVLEDDFSNQSGWRTGEFTSGRIAFGNEALTLAISNPKGTLSSLREGTLPANAYLENTARAALCKGNDIYGLLLRAASDRDGYRLMATCGGDIRLERLRNGEIALMQNWTHTGELPQGGMLPVRLGVWSMGSELRIFVNDVHQFSARDPVFQSGQVGIFARAAGDSPLTVNFSALSVYKLDAARIPTPTPLPTATP
jgi:hypothetical protein